MNTKPKLGVIAIAKKNHFKEEIYQFVSSFRGRFARYEWLDLVLDDEVRFDEYDIARRARQMEAEGVDLIMLVVGTWIYSSIVISAVNDLHTPFILYGLSHVVANGNLGASLQIRYILQEMNKNFLYLCGPIEDAETDAAILKYLKAAWVKRTLRNRKIGIIGGKCMMMYQTQVNEFNWKSIFGVDFPQYDTVQVFKEMEAISDAEAQRVADQFLARIDTVHWEAGGDRLEPDAILTQARMFLAFKRLQELYGIDIFANKCMPEMSAIPYGYGYAACLATCMLNEAGIITACEADVPAGLSMYILHLLTGQKVFFADIARLNKPRNKLTFFNCGTAPISMADRARGVDIWPIPGNIADEAIPEPYFVGRMKGGCISFVLEEDRPVTLLRIGGNDGTLRLHVASATTTCRDVEDPNDLGNRWPGFGLTFQEDVHRFLNHTTGHHYSIVYGDCAQELAYLAQILGIQFVYDQ